MLKELHRRFPEHEYLYFGDTANVPYGSKSPTQIRALCRSASLRMETKAIDALVIACNTAASLAYSEFKDVLNTLPILDVVEAGVNAVGAALADEPSHVVILGTRATIRSHIYSDLLKARFPERTIFEQECPLLVPLIEEGWLHHPALRLTVEEYLAPYRNLAPGVALLACTHYPWIRDTFQAALPEWEVLDSAGALATIAGSRLGLHGNNLNSPSGSIEWHFSDPEAISLHVLNQVGNELSEF